MPELRPVPPHPLVVYYHGTISPERVPPSVVEAIRSFEGRIRLRFAGYDALSSPGYAQRLGDRGRLADGTMTVEYAGLLPRSELLQEAMRAHVGIVFMPKNSTDINMVHMTGASNKAFDYMAAGLALLVNDQPDWQDIFVRPGFGRACDPEMPSSIAGCLKWFLDNPNERHAISLHNRRKIETEWNYDTQFAPVMLDLEKLQELEPSHLESCTANRT